MVALHPPNAHSLGTPHLTLDEIDKHFKVPDLGFQLLYKLLFHTCWVDDLCHSNVHLLTQLFWGQRSNVLTQVHVQLLDKLLYDYLQSHTGNKLGALFLPC